MYDEFKWSTIWKVPADISDDDLQKLIDSRFLDVITEIAWRRGYEIKEEGGVNQANVRFPGEVVIWIDRVNKNINFEEVPDDEIDDLAEELDEALCHLQEWEAKVRGEEN